VNKNVAIETWKDIGGYEGVYCVSNLGRVKRITSGRILVNLTSNSHGYPSVFLYKDGVRQHKLIHILVLETFVGKCPDGLECCHNNGDRTDARLENLRWDTRSANTHDAISHRTYMGSGCGSTNKNAKLHETDVVIIKRLLWEGHLTQKAIGALFGVSSTIINYINCGKRWRHVQ